MKTKQEKIKMSSLPKLWTLPFLNAMGINFFVTLNNSMVQQALPLYVMALGASKATAGLLGAFFTVAALTSRPFFGNLIDSKGRKITLIIGCGIFVITSFLYRVATIVPVLMVIRMIQGLGNSSYSTATGTIIADILPPKRLNEGVGYFGISMNIAQAIGPSVMLFISGMFGFPSVFTVTFITSSVALFLSSFINYEKKRKAEEAIRRLKLAEAEALVENQTDGIAKAQANAKAENEKTSVKSKKKFSINNIIEKSAIPAACIMIMTGLTAGMTGTFLVKYSQTLNISGIGLYFTVNAGALMCSRLFVGRICDRIGAQRALPPGIILVFCGVLTIATSHSLAQFLVAALIMGFGTGIINPTTQAFVLRAAPKNRRGVASATYYMATDIGSGVGSTLGGVMSQLFGFQFTFLFFSIFIVGAMLMFIFVMRPKIMEVAEREKQSPEVA